ncbi:Fic family protein [soil metagenome]
MYDSIEDPYCYAGTSVLRNLPELTDQEALTLFETVATAQRAEEPLPSGDMSVEHYKLIHHHFFQDVFPWAGEFRTVRIGKEGSGFCYPEHIPVQMNELFRELQTADFFQNTSSGEFVRGVAHFLSNLNAIHPFREGNGRTQNVFLQLLAEQAEHPIDFERLDEIAFMEAMIQSFRGDDSALETHIAKLIS